MRELKASTKAGQSVLASLNRRCGIYLEDVYKTYSTAKQTAWTKLWTQYVNDHQSYEFHLCSAACDFFTCGWYTREDGERIALYFTHKNQYKVYIDR